MKTFSTPSILIFILISSCGSSEGATAAFLSFWKAVENEDEHAAKKYLTDEDLQKIERSKLGALKDFLKAIKDVSPKDIKVTGEKTEEDKATITYEASYGGKPRIETAQMICVRNQWKIGNIGPPDRK